MFKKHLLYLTNEHLLSVIWRDGKTLAAESFPVDALGQATFANYLKRWAKLRVYFLVDLIEEDFRLDTIPHVRGGDRRLLLDRKLNQMYRGTPFRHAIVLDREAAGRRDDRVLYTSITNAELLTPWLDAIDAEQAPLEGIFSAPLLSVRLLKPLGQTAKHVLLVTLHQGNHLRQSYTYLGKTKFGRMSPLGPQSINNRLVSIGEEVRKTWQYLESLRYFESGDNLHVCVLVDPDDLNSASNAVHQQPGLTFEFFDITQAAKSIGLTRPLTDSNAEWLMLHMLGRRPPANHFARQELTHRSLIWRIKQTALAAGTGALLISATLGSANFLDGKLTTRQVKQIQGEMVRIEQERQLIMSALPTSNVAPDVMGNTVSFYNQTVNDAPDFARALIAVSRILSRFPNAELSDLTWAATTDPDKPSANAAVLALDLPPKPSIATNTSNVNSGAAIAPANGRYFQVLILAAKLGAFNQDQRQALEQIIALKTAIETDLGATVRVLALPLDPSAKVSLRGSAKPTPDNTEAQFALKIVLPPRP